MQTFDLAGEVFPAEAKANLRLLSVDGTSGKLRSAAKRCKLKRPAASMPLPFPRELIIDNFAGGGGTSTGLEAAFGRPVDIAINHDPEALAMHAINHPHTLHFCESVWDVDPIVITKNQPVGLVWLSPDCKHFSRAKGGTPVSQNIRGLAWVGLRWIAKTKPRLLALENVEDFLGWGSLLVDAEGNLRPDPSKKGKTFESFVRQIRAHGYQVDWRVLKACDNGAPTIRKRLFLVARRDGLPICFPEPTHGNPLTKEVLAGSLLPWRTAAECIDFEMDSTSIFDRKKELVNNTKRRIAKGLWRHVLNSDNPFIVERSRGAQAAANDVVAPFINEHANSSTQRTMRADEPLRTVCAQVKGGHFSVVAPTLVPMRGTHESQLRGLSVDQPLHTISAGGNHHALVESHLLALPAHSELRATHLITMGYGERPGQAPQTQGLEQPLNTAVTGGVKQAVVAAHLVDMGHGESCKSGAKRFSHGIRDIRTPLNTITASGGTSALTTAEFLPLGDVAGDAVEIAFLEQANGGFYDGDGRSMDQPVSTITASGSNQRLVAAYCVKYYSSGGQWQGLDEPMHTVPTKGRIGLVRAVNAPVDCLTKAQMKRARKCAALLHDFLPEQFPEALDMVILNGFVMIDITLRMLKPVELYKAQSFPPSYVIHEIPDPALLFVDGRQVPGDPRLLPRIPLTGQAQVRMCGNSVAPAQAEALIRANFSHELEIYEQMAA